MAPIASNKASSVGLLDVIRVIDKSATDVHIMPKQGAQGELDDVYDFFGEDDNIMELSHITYPAIAYKEVKRVMGISIKEYERIFAHTWRGIAQKQDDDSVDRAHSERLLSILRIYVQGVIVFGDPDKLNAWLSAFSPVLGTEPRQLLDTIMGCGKVSDELGRIDHGMLA